MLIGILQYSTKRDSNTVLKQMYIMGIINKKV